MELEVTLVGTSPLLMSSNRGLNPLDPDVKALREITKKRTKTDADYREIAQIEWRLRLYWDQKLGPYIPGQNIDATLVAAGRLRKMGKQLQRSVMTIEDKIVVQYTGPRDRDKR